MNSAPRTNQMYQLYQVPADINAPMMNEERFLQNTVNSYTTFPLEREALSQNPRVIHPQLNIVNNQTQANQYELSYMKKALKSSGQCVVCPFCKNQNFTRTEEKCSFANVGCGAIFGPVPWILFQAIRKKDINCYDADHFCLNCGSQLASYKAC